MMRDHDIERVLDQWLTEGPTRMPSRFLDDTFDAIDRLPPRRLAGLRSWRPAVSPSLRFATAAAAAAAAIVAVGGLGAIVLMRTGAVGSGTPTGSGLVPVALQAEWQPVGTHDIPGVSGPYPSPLDIVVGQTTLTIFDYHVDVLNEASLVGPDRIELRTLNLGKHWHCQVGDGGTYMFSLSPGGQRLTLTPVSDACAERAASLAGDWTRTVTGDLASGRHLAEHWAAFDGGSTGQLSFAVPTGWADIDEGGTFTILPRTNGPEQAEIRLLADVGPESPDGACVSQRTGAGGTPASVAAWLATLPGLKVTPPVPVTIGGISGVVVDLSVAPGWTNACAPAARGEAEGSPGPGPDDAYVQTFSDPSGDPILITAERRARYLLLGRGDGQGLVIAIEARDAATWDAAIANAMSIVGSFEFIR